jgi:chemotaxis protein CheZ
MSAQVKAFRIERVATETTSPAELATRRHRELMAGLALMNARLAAGIAAAPVAAAPASSSAAEEAAREMIALYKRELAEAKKLKNELDVIQAAISETKREIATLHKSGNNGGSMHRVSDELDAVVGGTEEATNTILQAAEAIDTNAKDLIAKLTGDDQGMASDIAEAVVQIFEACNFQDLTGQRITKVVNVLRFIDERVQRMTEIWGGMSAFEDVAPVADGEREGEKALLNGPALPGEDRASQDMIDALFG